MDATSEESASADYGKLVGARKRCDRCREDLRNPAGTNAGGHDLAQFDTDEVGPWSAWVGTRPAKLLLVGQDWGTVTYYLKNKGRDDPKNIASRRLLDRLEGIGVYDPDQKWEEAFKVPVFLTNAVLCLKMTETMSAPVRARCLSNCHPFLRATVRVTGVEAIIAMGQAAFEAVLGAFGTRPPHHFADIVNAACPIRLPDVPPIFVVYHPSVRPVNRDLAAQQRDWKRVGNSLREHGILEPGVHHPQDSQPNT